MIGAISRSLQCIFVNREADNKSELADAIANRAVVSMKYKNWPKLLVFPGNFINFYYSFSIYLYSIFLFLLF